MTRLGFEPRSDLAPVLATDTQGRAPPFGLFLTLYKMQSGWSSDDEEQGLRVLNYLMVKSYAWHLF